MFNTYIDLKVEGLDCMMASGFKVTVLVTGLVFVFKSALLVLKQVPTCIRKPKTNKVKSKFLHLPLLVVLIGFRSF